MKTILSSSRYLILLAVLAAFASAVTLLIFGAYDTGLEIAHIIGGKIPKSLAATFIEIADLFLLGVVMYIIALGLYELFIDDKVPLPEWLAIHSFDDLKSKLISIAIVVLGVTFLSQAVRWDGEQDLLGYGVAVGLVIAALTYFISVKGKKAASHAEKDETEA